MAANKKLIAKINALPQEYLGAVEKFVDSISINNDKDRACVHLMTKASAPSLAAVWDNDADAVYDAI
jgi:hypothetical protein